MIRRLRIDLCAPPAGKCLANAERSADGNQPLRSALNLRGILHLAARGTARTARALLIAVFASAACGASAAAESNVVHAWIRAVAGTVTFAPMGGSPVLATAGATLAPGAVVQTGPNSVAEIFFGDNAGFVRLVANTRLVINKIEWSPSLRGVVTALDLDLQSGTLVGSGNKSVPPDDYQIKVSNGVAGIGPGQFRINDRGYVVVVEGSVVFVHVAPTGDPIPYTIKGAPPTYFSPIEGLKPAPKVLETEVLGQLRAKLRTRTLPSLESASSPIEPREQGRPRRQF